MSAPATTELASSRFSAQTLRFSGSARLVLIINLSSFVTHSDADAFRHLRGSEAFAATLRGLQPTPPFLVDEDAAALERNSYALRIFRSRLIYNHFFPTYRVAWDATLRERFARAGYDDLERWRRWTPRIRLTRNGLAVITLEQAFDGLSPIAAIEQVLELPPESGRAVQDQWSLGMLILQAFLEALGRAIIVSIGDRQHPIHFVDHSDTRHTIRLDRYIIYSLQRVTCDGELVMPADLKHEAAPILASMMEGTLVEFDGVRRLPHFALDQAAMLMAQDVSTWDEELCLLTGESALIYCPLAGRGVAYLGAPHGLDDHAYATYWNGVMRGIEHCVAFRSEVQQAERRTTDLLSHIPMLTRKMNDGEITQEDIRIIDHLATGLADIFDSLPEQRSMAVSSTAFRSDYTQSKFEALLERLHVEQTIALVNTNVEQLSFFLSYYNDMRLQWQAQRTNTVGMVLGAIVLFMALSSFMADTFSVAERLGNQQNRLFVEAVIGVVGLSILGIMIWRARRVLHWRTHGRPAHPPSFWYHRERR